MLSQISKGILNIQNLVLGNDAKNLIAYKYTGRQHLLMSQFIDFFHFNRMICRLITKRKSPLSFKIKPYQIEGQVGSRVGS